MSFIICIKLLLCHIEDLIAVSLRSKLESAFAALPHIQVYKFEHRQIAQLADLVERKIQITVSISAGELCINCKDKELTLDVTRLL